MAYIVSTPSRSTPNRRVTAALTVAAAVGLVHAAFSVLWAFGGTWLLWSLGHRMIDLFAGHEWALLPAALLKGAVAVMPLWLARRGKLGEHWVRVLGWVAAVVLVLWGGGNTLVGNLVLAGAVRPDGGYDRDGMIGHAWLWDPMFLVWGLALVVALRRTRPKR